MTNRRPALAFLSAMCSRKTIGIAAAYLVFICATAHSQNPGVPNGSQAGNSITSLPVFEVISIRPNVSGSQSMFSHTADGFTVTGGSLIQLISMAYGFWGVADFEKDRLIGAPDWTRDARYDITAKVADADVPGLSKLTMDQRRQMLRPVLEDRFKLKAHMDTRVLSAYRFVVAKGGAKLQEAKPGHVYADKMGGAGTGANRMSAQRGVLRAQAIALPTLANFLAQQLGRPVVDETNLSDHYDFTLRYAPDSLSAQAPPGDNGQGSVPQSNVDGPSIFTALPEQLGLQLESGKVPVPVLVIDHIERPSEN